MQTRTKVAITVIVACIVTAITFACMAAGTTVELLAFGWAVVGVPAIMMRA